MLTVLFVYLVTQPCLTVLFLYLSTQGAETEMRCRWTDMNALHYAVFFDSPEVVEALADHNPSLVMSVCSEFNSGNGLHIAAANLSLSAAKVLVSPNLLHAVLTTFTVTYST